jgi:hypothetical protein
MLNPGMVNGGASQFIPAEKRVIFCVFTRKSAIQKVR